MDEPYFDAVHSQEINNEYSTIDLFLDTVTNDNQCYKSLNIVEMNDRVYSGKDSVISSGMGTSFGLVGIAVGVGKAAYNELNKEKHLGIFGSSLDKFTVQDSAADYFSFEKKDNWANWFLLGQTNKEGTANFVGVLFNPADKNPNIIEVGTDEYKNLDPSIELISYCDAFSTLYSGVADGYKSYFDCGDLSSATTKQSKASISKCRSKALHEIELARDTLKETCRTIIKNQQLSAQDGCIQSCLNANETLNILQKEIDNNNETVTDCPISNKLGLWIINIVRWIKYIIPAFVIIFGIVDFLRAIASEKDDEMKKAQGRFIKRLIAAALIFVIPFILEFILDKFGFSVYGCGVINL